MRASIDQQFRSVFGAGGAPALESFTTSTSPTVTTTTDEHGGSIYPYRFPQVTPVLGAALGTSALTPQRVGAVNDLAGLLVLDAVDFPQHSGYAASIAYALYDVARRTGACEPQLNVAVLASTNQIPPPFGALAAEFRRAAADCPGDPTPLWFLGQYQSLYGDSTPSAFAQVEQQYPRSALGWSGEGDALVRYG
jgi:hypothetical protein